MTKKHFIAIAAVLAGDFASAPRGPVRYKVRDITFSLADEFGRFSPNFNRATFYVAVFGTSYIDEIAGACAS